MAGSVKVRAVGRGRRGVSAVSSSSSVGDVQRVRVLAAAMVVVGEVGYSGMSVARVTARAGVSRRTFYDLFEDREDCFLAVFEGALARVEGVVSVACVGVGGGWREQVRAGLGALLCLFDEDRGLGSLLVVEALGAGPRVLAGRAQVLEDLASTIEDGARAGKSQRTRQGRSQRSSSSRLVAEGVVGAVFSVVHTRMLQTDHRAPSLLGLLNELMGIIVLPYEGAGAARKELARPLPKPATRQPKHRKAPGRSSQPPQNPLESLPMRLTYRTLRVLATVAEHPGASNREIAQQAGVNDQGQISKLLARLHRLDLVTNTGEGQPKGEPNAWTLTPHGRTLQAAIHPTPTTANGR
jgi:AcrR family transcriptional regulator/DNA-binding MarR family transcriptional regulator